MKYADEVAAIVAELRKLPDAVAQVLASMETVRALARELADADTVLFLGRHVGYPVALEGALKLKELAYMHAEGFAAGELKHGPIALIDEGTPVVVVVPVAAQPRSGARQGRLQHPGGPRPRRPHHRDRRGGRRGRRALRRPPDPRAAHPDAARPAGHHGAAAGARLRDRRRPRSTTSTSRATWPSPSPSSSTGRDQVT